MMNILNMHSTELSRYHGCLRKSSLIHYVSYSLSESIESCCLSVMLGWCELRSSHIHLQLRRQHWSNQWTSGETSLHATPSAAVFALSQVWQSVSPQGVCKKWLGFLVWFEKTKKKTKNKKTRWISIIQKGKKKKAFECQIPIQAGRCTMRKNTARI